MKLKRRVMAFPVLALWLIAVALVRLGVCEARTLNYHDFSSTTGLILQENAAPVKGHLRLTPAIAGKGLGGAWLGTKQSVKDGFATTFQIQITDKHSAGADGMAFVIQGGTEPGLGQTGQGLGYGGIRNQFVVHFDNWHWIDHPTAGAYDEIAVLAAASPGDPLANVSGNIIASVNKQVNFSDGAVHTVKIVYAPGNLQVFLDDLKNPLMTAYANIAKLMNLDEGRAWVGFTGSGGGDWQNQDVVSWSFASNDAALRGSGISDATVKNPLFSAPGSPTTGVTPLASDRTFGYAMPSSFGPAFRIEASTDLVDWLQLTNAAFYFKDLDATNYPARFYRFVPK